MGDQQVAAPSDPSALHRFSRALLDDLEALERMLADGRLERGVQRLGFEQECFLVDAAGRPAPVNEAVLRTLDDPAFTTEIGRYNIELNVDPLELSAGCLTALESTLTASLSRARDAARAHGADVLLAGTLPSLVPSDLTRENMTPTARYHALSDRLVALSGGVMRTSIQGLDALHLELDSVMLESCNTSIQVHLQVDPDRLPAAYNAAQLAAGPLLTASANSPLLLQQRLWHESRIPAFEQSVDLRASADRARGSLQRVHFGEDWVHESILEVYRDQVARHRVLLVGETGEPSTELLSRGVTPPLRALALHNGSLYRWNRLCYGTAAGVPHVRIEHRPLPAGPTVLDEVANTALFLGLVLGLEARYGDVRERFAFRDARANFHAAAHEGLDATLRWADGEAAPAARLLLDELLPLAHEGLQRAGIADIEAERFLGMIEQRVGAGRTGARWTLDAFEQLKGVPARSARTQAVTRAIASRQWSGTPVGEWSAVRAEEGESWPEFVRSVHEIMTTDLFTVRPDDLLDVAARVMHWKHVRHVPVQDDDGRLVGLLSHRALLSARARPAGEDPLAVRDVMDTDVAVTSPTTSCHEAMRQLRALRVGSLPVVRDGQLVGIVSERDFLPFAERWFAERAAHRTDQESSSPSS